MQNKLIRITRLDMQRLQSLLDNPDLMQQKPYLQKLEGELRRAEVVESHAIPPDTVTMNSTVRLVDRTSGEEMIFTLVYPDQAALRDGKISVLAPVGTAILGCREGETIDWEVPAGKQRLTVDRVLYQPEAAGEYGR
jgi:regulator of nucleoside diphosphate kinase